MARSRARCGKKDAADLETLRNNSVSDPASLQSQVAMAVSQAWRIFHEGKTVLWPERVIGQIPDTEIFVMPPIRTRANRWFIILTCCLLIFFLLEQAPFFQLGLSGLKPVSVTETEVRAFFDDIPPNPDPNRFDSPVLALVTCRVLPPTNLFSPEGLRAMRDDVAGRGGFDSLKQSDSRAQAIFNAFLPRRAVANGWISWSDLAMQPSEAAAFLRTNRFRMYSPDKWDNFLTRGESWSWVKQERFKVMRIQADGVTQLRLLRALNCLDLIDREKLIQQIASVQVLSATPAPGQPPIHLWRDVRGLFFTPGWPALQDTYFSLAALEILGGLDKIDREACIKGILRRHQGKGWFTSPNGGGFNEYHIDGSERDTIAAFESLRILGALDRVKDLEKWQFRPQHRDGDMNVTWQDVEAWVCQQRLEKILRERKENPQAPVHSLLDP